MKNKGLCTTCVHVATCIFSKEPSVVWQCEEFSSGNSVPTKQVKVKRVIREEITESE